MTYKLIVTKRADELLDHIIHHLLSRLKNPRAAEHLLNGIETVYTRLEENPHQFPLSRDACLAKKTYHKAILPQMDYKIIFQIRADTVYIMGIFHQLENYRRKLPRDPGDQFCKT